MCKFNILNTFVYVSVPVGRVTWLSIQVYTVECGCDTCSTELRGRWFEVLAIPELSVLVTRRYGETAGEIWGMT